MGMRDDLAGAIDDLEVGDELEQTPQEIITDEIETGDESPDNSGDLNEELGDNETPPSDEEKSELAEDAGVADSAEPASGDPASSEPTKPSTDSLKAPVDWTPKDRELWSKIPRQLQERIVARERDMADHMANTKEARQLQDSFNEIGRSFAPIMAAEGFSHPMEAMQAAFGTMTNLRMGTPQQKAQEIANIIGQYGVDIEALDNALVGAPQQAQPQSPQGGVAPQQQQAIEQILQQHLAPVNQMIQQQEQAKITEANKSVADFAQQNEFLQDVREDMADIIEIAAKRGVNLTLQQAYDRACAAHPEISGVMQQRRQDAQIKGNQATLAQKRHASSSISGRQLGSGGGGNAGSLRDSIAAAFDDAASG